ncbi:cysteine-rich motor neuron 1 protein-like isoform X1 [Asterias amurensis]|uniref:cysteine-rich motor neuron 1 protein-like isoform X1 n=1 Tax=Asterias amurensis TaxID=7602 RepID=UPI003AB73A85
MWKILCLLVIAQGLKQSSQQATTEYPAKIPYGDFFPCVNNLEERILHDHGDEWQENKCKKCACQNGTTTCDVTVCGGIPHESCVEKYTSVDQCCPEYECDSLPCIDEQGLSHNDGEAWEPDNCQQCNCVNGKLSCNHTICSAKPHESCVEKPTSEDQCCPVYQCNSLPCKDDAGISHKHAEVWSTLCTMCYCLNGIQTCRKEVCAGKPHESCVIKQSSGSPKCCPEYECDSLPCIDQQGLSHNDGEAWEPDNCQQCYCVNGKLSCNHTICSAKPHESCVEIPASEDQCCPVYQCNSLPCIDQQGLSHNDGEAWEPDNCQQCNCVNGKQRCNHTICSAKPHESCVEIPASEDQCCPVYQCTSIPCRADDGTEHEHGSTWDVDDCKSCKCQNGEVICMVITCPKPLGKYLAVAAPGHCCPHYELEGCMQDGKHYAHNEKTSDDPCTWCQCVNGQLFCNVWFCPDAGNPHKLHAVKQSHSPCRHLIPPGSCCPGKKIVCEQPISECLPNAPAVQTPCNDNMCWNASCKNHPSAKCTISRCGQCHVIFTDDAGEEVDCGNSQNE